MHRYACEARKVLSRLSSASVHSCASKADSHDKQTANTVWTGLGATLSLWFSANANTSDGEMELSTNCCCERNSEEGQAGQGAPTAIWGIRPTLLRYV